MYLYDIFVVVVLKLLNIFLVRNMEYGIKVCFCVKKYIVKNVVEKKLLMSRYDLSKVFVKLVL